MGLMDMLNGGAAANAGAAALQTKNLVLRLMGDEALQEAIDESDTASERAEWQSYLAESQADPANRQWTVPWEVTLKSDQDELVGTAWFNGAPAEDTSVEIGYAILEEHAGQGYDAEIVVSLGNFALQRGAGFLECSAANEHAAEMLTKMGFKAEGEPSEDGDQLYVIQRPQNKTMFLFALCGLAIGMVLGSYITMAIGAIIGGVYGYMTDSKAAKAAAALLEKRQELQALTVAPVDAEAVAADSVEAVAEAAEVVEAEVIEE